MEASRYIGRIGGLAVALGVGTAIITGQGIAVAIAEDPPSDNSDTGDGSGGNAATVKNEKPDDAGEPSHSDWAPPRDRHDAQLRLGHIDRQAAVGRC